VDRVRTSSSRPNGGAREARDGVGRIVSNDGGRSGGVGDRGVEPVQDVAAAGTDPIVSGAASAVARVRLAGGLQENTTEPDGQKRIPEERVWRRNIYSS
jgi:hypothetical protein